MTFREYRKTFDILNKLILSKNFFCGAIIIGLNYCFRRLDVQKLCGRKTGGQLRDETFRRVGITSKKAIARASRALQFWSANEVQKIILLLNNYDFEIRKIGASFAKHFNGNDDFEISQKQLETVRYEHYESGKNSKTESFFTRFLKLLCFVNTCSFRNL